MRNAKSGTQLLAELLPPVGKKPTAKKHRITLDLTRGEAAFLYETLLQLHEDMNDDGREGYFESTPLESIYNKLVAIPKERR